MKIEKFPPFSPLSENDIKIGVELEDTENDVIYLVLPEAAKIEPVAKLDMISDLNIDFVNSESFDKSRRLAIPSDSLNYGNFSVENLDPEQGVILNKVNSIYERLSILSPDVERSQILFSSTQHSVYILPKIILE